LSDPRRLTSTVFSVVFRLGLTPESLEKIQRGERVSLDPPAGHSTELWPGVVRCLLRGGS